MTAELKRSSEGQTLILTISNPAHRNALGPEMYTEGIEALSLAERSADARTVVIAGEGSLFSAGGDLQRLQANRQQPASHQARKALMHCTPGSTRALPRHLVTELLRCTMPTQASASPRF